MLLEGILLGLTLSLMIGPLLFAIVQAALEKGMHAGIAVAMGLWISDLLFILLIYSGSAALGSFAALPHFKWYAGLLGGSLLFFFGLGALINQREIHLAKGQVRSGTLVNYFLRGFLLNTINPFTVFFWLGIGSGIVATNRDQGFDLFRFFLGMMITLALTDVLKAWGAKHLRNWLTPAHIQRVQQGIGMLLIIFGLVLIGRSVANS